MKSTRNCPLMTTGWQLILLVVVIFSYSKNIWLNNELQTTRLLGVLTYFLGYESSLLLSLCVLLARFLNNYRELMGFLIEVPTSFSSIEKLAKNGKWLILRGTHQKKSGGHARFFLLLPYHHSVKKSILCCCCWDVVHELHNNAMLFISNFIWFCFILITSICINLSLSVYFNLQLVPSVKLFQ